MWEGAYIATLVMLDQCAVSVLCQSVILNDDLGPHARDANIREPALHVLLNIYISVHAPARVTSLSVRLFLSNGIVLRRGSEGIPAASM